MSKFVFAILLFCLSQVCFAGWGVGDISCSYFLKAVTPEEKYAHPNEFRDFETTNEFEEWLMGYMTVFGEYMDNKPTEEHPYDAVKARINFYCKDPDNSYMAYGVAVKKAMRDVYRPKQKLQKHVIE